MSEWQPLAITLASATAWVVIVLGLLQVLIYLVQLIYSGVALAVRPPVARPSLIWRRYADQAPAIAVLAPAFNEEASIIESVHSLLGLHYPNFEIIVINDGSEDQTLPRLVQHFGLVPVARFHDRQLHHAAIRGLYGSPELTRLLVIDKENGGKADALNAGINVARSPLFCSIDADSLLESDALLRVVGPFVEQPELTVAVGGTVRLANGSHVEGGRILEPRLPFSFLELVQVVEYMRSFLMARLALSKMRALTVISGAFGLFNRELAVEVDGYSNGTVGEDMELVIKFHRHLRDSDRPYRIEFIPEPVCWTLAPHDLRTLGLQRARWQRGALETFFKHKDMLFNPRYGRVGFLGFGHILVIDVVGPVVEALGYLLIPLMWWIGLLSVDYLLAFLAVSFTFSVFLSVTTLILEEVELRRLSRASDLVVLTLVSILESVGYRQLNNLWRLVGLWGFLRKHRSWGQMKRNAFATA